MVSSNGFESFLASQRSRGSRRSTGPPAGVPAPPGLADGRPKRASKSLLERTVFAAATAALAVLSAYVAMS